MSSKSRHSDMPNPLLCASVSLQPSGLQEYPKIPFESLKIAPSQTDVDPI